MPWAARSAASCSDTTTAAPACFALKAQESVHGMGGSALLCLLSPAIGCTHAGAAGAAQLRAPDSRLRVGGVTQAGAHEDPVSDLVKVYGSLVSCGHVG